MIDKICIYLSHEEPKESTVHSSLFIVRQDLNYLNVNKFKKNENNLIFKMYLFLFLFLIKMYVTSYFCLVLETTQGYYG